MALTVGSILQMKLFQEMQGQQVLNTAWFEVLAATNASSLAGFAEPLWVHWIAAFAAQQSSQLRYVRLELYEHNGIDFDIFVPTGTVTGTAAGELVSNFEAFSIQLVRASRATRHGWKRLAGVTEPQITNGNLSGATITALQNGANTIFNSALVLEDTAPAQRSIVVRGIIWGGNDPQYPLGRFSDIADVRISPRTTTQNTRKIGRGA